jgi:cytochrome c
MPLRPPVSVSPRPVPPGRRWPGGAASGLAACALAGCMGPAVPPEASGGDPQRGRLLLAQYQCGSCHTIPGVVGARGAVAVPLQDFGRRSYIAGRLPNQPHLLARWIAEPQALVPADARDMAAYLGSRG